MGWDTIAQLIITIGMPAVEKVIANWENKTPVTLAEFQNLRAAAQQTAKDRMLKTLATLGIDPASPQGVALVASATV